MLLDVEINELANGIRVIEFVQVQPLVLQLTPALCKN
jgi:hypothetical protein